MTTAKPLPNKRGRKPGTKFTQRPQSDHEKARRVQIPTLPTISKAEDKAAADMQQAARVEILMLKGISSPMVLGQLLGIESDREVNRLIALVHSRWQISGSGRDVQRARGESLARLSMIESEIWSKLSDNDAGAKPSDRIASFKLLIEIAAQRDALAGLAPRVIERMTLLPQSDNSMVSRLQAQAGLSTAAQRFLEIMASRRAALDGPATIEHETEDGIDFTDDAENSTSH